MVDSTNVLNIAIEDVYTKGLTDPKSGERAVSGIYFYNLTAGDHIATRKMTVTKRGTAETGP